MAEKKSGSVRFDDFVGAVHADPANVEPKHLLSGFVGRSEDEGKLRIYSDPSLSSWVEASAEDVVHSQPIADSPLGGSHVWLKAGAELSHGSAQGPAGAAAAAVGGIGADTGVFNPAGAILPTQFCPTHITCPPISLATVCTQYSPCGPIHTREIFCPPQTIRIDQCGGPIHTLVCPTRFPVVCPPHTLLIQECGGPVHTAVCPTRLPGFCPPHTLLIQECGGPITLVCPTHNPHTCPVATGGIACPSTLGCPIHGGSGPVEHPQVHAMAAAAPPTGMFGCPQTSTCSPPTHMLGCPGSSTCTPPTHLIGCPGTSTCATPTHMFGCPGSSTCTPVTHMLGCPNSSTCPPTHMYGCPNSSTCPPTHMYGCPQTSTCPPTHMPGCPNTSTCTPTHNPGCGGGGIHTQAGCFPTLGCPMTAPPFCPATIGCPAG